jgi:hypothetical protein
MVEIKVTCQINTRMINQSKFSLLHSEITYYAGLCLHTQQKSARFKAPKQKCKLFTDPCFTYWESTAGTSIKSYASDQITSTQECQLACQLTLDCTAFVRNLKNGNCTLMKNVTSVLIAPSMVRGPKECTTPGT